MRLRLTTTAALLSLTLGGMVAEPPPARAAVAYLDAAAWLSAAGSLGAVKLVPLTLHSPVFSDAWGAFSNPNETVYVPAGPPPPPFDDYQGWNEQLELPRSMLSGSDGWSDWLGPGSLQMTFGCLFSAVYPCFGIQTFDAKFAQPILGFGGFFEWFTGYDGYDVIPITVNGTALSSAVTPPVWPNYLYEGFLGFIGPMDTFSMHWHGGNADNFALVRWSGPFAIVAMPVSEPSALALLAGALLGLLVLGAPASPQRIRG